MTKIAVVGHVEWVEFVRVSDFPRRGEITPARDAFFRAGGGAVVAATALRHLGADVDFFCALGHDDDGKAAAAQLRGRGVAVFAAWHDAPTRRVITFLEDGGERTIITVGERLQPCGDDDLPWDRLDDAAAVYFTAGDAGAARRARRAGTLVSTPRAHEALTDGGAMIDALVLSASDPDERRWATELDTHTRLTVVTEGPGGGYWDGETSGRWEAVEPDGEPQDDYGCGDSFAAGLTLGLGQGLGVAEAARIGSQAGAWAVTRAGAP